MSTFTQYLTEAAKSYDYKVKVAGMIADDFKNRMETALQKFDLAKCQLARRPLYNDDASRFSCFKQRRSYNF
jgi:hypothetical protein